jgi:anthranilate 1,2-dioxygenase small subunit
VPRENAERDLHVALMHCDSHRMLRDRVTAHRKANLFAPHVYRHLVSSVRITGREDGMLVARANYAVFRSLTDSMTYGTSELSSVGEYRDRIIVTDAGLNFKGEDRHPRHEPGRYASRHAALRESTH